MTFSNKYNNGRRDSRVEKLPAGRAFLSSFSGLLPSFCPTSTAKLVSSVPLHDLNGFVHKRKTLFIHFRIRLSEVCEFHSLRRLCIFRQFHGIAVSSLKCSKILFPSS